MDAITAIKNRRTVRKFTQEEIPNEKLVELVNLARLAPYGANVQPLKYVIIQEKSLRDRIFPHTKWAGYLPAEKGRPEGADHERHECCVRRPFRHAPDGLPVHHGI